MHLPHCATRRRACFRFGLAIAPSPRLFVAFGRERGDPGFERAHFHLLLIGGSGDERGRIRHAAILASLRYVVEEGEKPVVVALRDGIVFVIVTTRAFQREPQPRHAERANAVGNILNPVLFVDDATLGVDNVIASKTGGDALVQGGVRQEIAGQLLRQKTIVALVGVEALNHPIAPTPHGARRVVIESVGIGVAGHVQPIHRHTLAIGGRRQQAAHCRAVRRFAMLSRVSCERIRVLKRSRQASQVQRNPPQPSSRIRGCVGTQPIRLQPLEDESVDLIFHPARVRGLGRRRPLGRFKGPVPGIFSAFFDPAFENAHLLGGQCAIGISGRHLPRPLLDGDALVDAARRRLSRHESGTALMIGSRALARIQPQ